MLKSWAISKVLGDGTPGTNPYRPSIGDDFPGVGWHDILYAQPPYVPAVAISRALCEEATALQIHQGVRSLILAAEVWNDVTEEWDDYIRNGTNWGRTAPFTDPRWIQIRDGLVALGMEAAQIDNWKTNNPDATPTEFYHALKVFLDSQGVM